MTNTISQGQLAENINELADSILAPALNMPSIEVSNVTVSFKTPKGIYTAVKDIVSIQPTPHLLFEKSCV